MTLRRDRGNPTCSAHADHLGWVVRSLKCSCCPAHMFPSNLFSSLSPFSPNMVTISLRWLAAVSVSAWLPAVFSVRSAKQPHPGGPIQTPPPSLKELAVHAAAPRAVTQHPHARGLLQKRDT